MGEVEGIMRALSLVKRTTETEGVELLKEPVS
jgi:hypothetical protein